MIAAFSQGQKEGDYATGIKSVIEVALQSPEFLYRVELPAGGPPESLSAPLRLSSWQLASRLSYLFWGTMPDGELFDAAETGALATESGVLREAERLIADPRTRTTMAHFYEQWLALDKLGGSTARSGVGTFA